MNKYLIDAIVTRALVDPAFTKALLNGQRRQKLAEFDLSPELVDVILSIQGNDIHQFIVQLYELNRSSQWDTPSNQFS